MEEECQEPLRTFLLLPPSLSSLPLSLSFFLSFFLSLSAIAIALDIRERDGLTFRISQPTSQKCQKKRSPCATTGVLACSSVFDHVPHSAERWMARCGTTEYASR